jgi:AcrR family transcriptional regulator
MESAYKVFARHGIEGASVQEIAESAGYSRGAFYANFNSKSDLLHAMLRAEMQRHREALTELISRAESPAEQLRALRNYYLRLFDERDFCLLWVESQLYAIRTSRARKGLAEILRQHRAAVAPVMDRLFEQAGRQLPNPCDQLIIALVALAEGVTLQRLVDPEGFPPEHIEMTMKVVFDRLTGYIEELEPPAADQFRYTYASSAPAI